MFARQSRRLFASRRELRFLSLQKDGIRAAMKARTAALVLLGWLFLIFPAGAERSGFPHRVASLNQCTDQLLVLLAPPERIASVSFVLKQKQWTPPGLSEVIARLASNYGRAEDMLVQKPDLIVTSQYASRSTVFLLRRLGYRVEEFPPENSFSDIRANVLRMGRLLGLEDRAQEIVAAFDLRLSDLRGRSGSSRGVLADVGVGGFLSGAGTLSEDVAGLAGYQLLGAKMGLSGFGYAAVEEILLARPDAFSVSNAWSKPPSLATDALRHPALRRAGATARVIDIPDRLLICGAPHSLEAAERMLGADADGRRR